MIHKLSNTDLHLQTKKFVHLEKANTVQVLKHLEEVHRRKLFIDFGYSTLMKYMVSELGYSEAESWTRISAMKLIERCPDAEDKMIQGSLSLSNAATINDAIRSDITKDPRKLIEESKGKPNRQVKRELNPDKKEKRILLNERILKKMAKLLGEMTEIELIESLLDEKLKEKEVSKTRTSKKPCDNKQTRYISIQVKKEIFERSNHRCEHVVNGVRCLEKRNLQYDHIQPYSLGGNRSSENLRMLCSGHNQHRSFHTFKDQSGYSTHS